MIRQHTTRLFYNKHTHVAMFDGQCCAEMLAWLGTQVAGGYRKYTHRRRDGSVRQLCIYSKGDEHARIMAKWGHAAHSVTVPIDTLAEDLLLSGVRIDVRESRYYKRYRYVMRFWNRNCTTQELEGWLQQRLGKPQGNYKMVRTMHCPNLYLKDESQLAMLRLCEPPSRVVEVVRVYTHEEVNIAIR